MTLAVIFGFYVLANWSVREDRRRECRLAWSDITEYSKRVDLCKQQ